MARSEDRKAALIAELARSRARIGNAAVEVRAHLNVGAKIKRSVMDNRWVWISGAAACGVLIATLPRWGGRNGRHRSEAAALPKAAKTGLAVAVMKIAFDLAKPALMKMATRGARDYFSRYTRYEV